MVVVVGALLASVGPILAQSPPSVGSTASFAVLGGTSVTNSGSTFIAGNAGASAGNVTGAPFKFVIGEVRTNDALARQAQEDNAAAYRALASGDCKPLATLDEAVLQPNVYCLSSATLSGTLTLDGPSDGVWIFRISTSLTTSAASVVQTVNGAKDSKVFWRVAGPATVGANSVFVGNVLTLGNITVNSRANISGRLLSQAVVALDDSSVTICCEVLSIDQRTLSNGDKLTASGGTPPYRFAVVAGELPSGLTLSRGGVLSGTTAATGAFRVAVAVTDAAGLSCIRVYTITNCGPIALSSLPDPLACLFYDETIHVDGGTPPYTFSRTPEKLPAGLTGPSPASGTITGTPTTVEDYDFTVTVTDALACTGSRRYTGHVGGGLVLLPDTLSDGLVGDDYSAVFTVTGGTGPYTFSFSGDVPTGLIPVPADPSIPSRMLTGKPLSGGCYTVTVTVTTPACEVAVTRDYKLVIRPVTVTFRPDRLPPGTVCTPYCQVIAATGCTDPLTFDEVPAGVLPPGLTFDPKTGRLCGTPKKPGTYPFTVVARDASGGPVSHSYSLEIDCPTITIAPPQIVEAKACLYYEQQLTVTGCDGPYEFTADPATVPKDLNLSPQGLLSGIPATPGQYVITVTVTPKECPPVVFHIPLKVPCNVTISPPSLLRGFLGVPYSRSLTASCGTPPYTLTLSSGNLPPGLGLSATGTISGTPLALGCYTFTVRATDAAGCAGERTYVLCIVLAAANVPMLSPWRLVVLAALLLIAGLAIIRRTFV